MKKAVSLLLAAVFLLVPLTVSAEDASDPLAFAGPAKGAVLMDAATGRVLYEKDCHEPLPMASTTKIMTALITLEQPNLDDYFVVDSDAIRVEGSSMGLREGDQVSLRALAWGMLLASGNDAAGAAAVRIAGSQEAFIELMNERAEKIGMKDTHFCSVSGLDIGDHHSTAYDMALLAREALENEVFAEMVSSKTGTISYGNPPYPRRLTNHNKLLWNCEDCIGLKTGFTKKAGRCLVSAASREGLTVIVVTLGCPDDFNVHHEIVDKCFEKLSFVDCSQTVQNLSVPVAGGTADRVAVKPLWQLGAFLTEEEKTHYQVGFTVQPFLYAPVEEGQVVGEAVLTLKGEELVRSPLVSDERIPTRFVDRRSILEQVEYFFARPEDRWFPLGQPHGEIPYENP